MLKSKNSPSFSLDYIPQIPSSIAIVDTNFKLISKSPRWQANFNLRLQEVEGKNLIELFTS